METLKGGFYIHNELDTNKAINLFEKENAIEAQVASKTFINPKSLRLYLEECIEKRFIPWFTIKC